MPPLLAVWERRSRARDEGLGLVMDAALPEVVTVKQAAGWLQVSRETLLRLIRLGRLPASRIGRALRTRRVDLELLVLRQRVSSREAPEGLLEVEMSEDEYRSLPVWRFAKEQ